MNRESTPNTRRPPSLRLRNNFETRSTAANGRINVEVCSQCHPFYTGKQKMLDTGGRVARFEKRYGKRSVGPRRRPPDAPVGTGVVCVWSASPIPAGKRRTVVVQVLLPPDSFFASEVRSEYADSVGHR